MIFNNSMVTNVNKLYSLFFNEIPFLESFNFNKAGRFLVRKFANFMLPIYLLNFPYENENTRTENIIITLTSFPARIPKLWVTIECLLRQTIRAKKIILYLSKDQFPNLDKDLPTSLLRLKDKGLDIIFVDGDIKSHKKYYYTMKDFPDDLIITVDDDIFYASNFVENLYENHLKYPNSIICSYGRKMKRSNDNNFVSSVYWPHLRKSLTGSDFFFGTGGGVLFPGPKSCLYKDYLNINLAIRLCPLEDDLWLNTMVRLNNTTIRTAILYKDILPVFHSNNIKLYSLNGNNEENMTDKQLKLVIEYYKQQGLNPYNV